MNLKIEMPLFLFCGTKIIMLAIYLTNNKNNWFEKGSAKKNEYRKHYCYCLITVPRHPPHTFNCWNLFKTLVFVKNVLKANTSCVKSPSLVSTFSGCLINGRSELWEAKNRTMLALKIKIFITLHEWKKTSVLK